MAQDPESPSKRILDYAARMVENGAALKEIQDHLWFGFCFHTNYPVYYEGLLDFCFRLYERFKESKEQDCIPKIMLLLGRVYNAKKEYLPACRFYKVARESFKGHEGIIAMEFFREELLTPEAQKQIGLLKEQFEEKYSGDTAEGLMRECGKTA